MGTSGRVEEEKDLTQRALRKERRGHREEKPKSTARNGCATVRGDGVGGCGIEMGKWWGKRKRAGGLRRPPGDSQKWFREVERWKPAGPWGRGQPRIQRPD